MTHNLQKYNHMWTSDLSQYWLIPHNLSYAIYDSLHKAYLTIEDDDDYLAVIQKLLEAGAAVKTDEDVIQNDQLGLIIPPHYYIDPSKFDELVAAGAKIISYDEIIESLNLDTKTSNEDEI